MQQKQLRCNLYLSFVQGWTDFTHSIGVSIFWFVQTLPAGITHGSYWIFRVFFQNSFFYQTPPGDLCLCIKNIDSAFCKSASLFFVLTEKLSAILSFLTWICKLSNFCRIIHSGRLCFQFVVKCYRCCNSIFETLSIWNLLERLTLKNRYQKYQRIIWQGWFLITKINLIRCWKLWRMAFLSWKLNLVLERQSSILLSTLKLCN